MNSVALKLHKKTFPQVMEMAIYGRSVDVALNDMIDSLKCKMREIGLEQK